MRPSPDCRHEGGGAGRLRVGIVAILVACAVVLPVSDLGAQGLDECPDTEIASAVDNYRLSWVVTKGRLGAESATEDKPKAPDSPGTFWERVTDESYDGVDSLRSGTIGDNEHAELTARIAGGTTLSFWWKVDSQERADYLTFSAAPEIEAGTADGPSAPPAVTAEPIDGKRDWTRVEVVLPGETAYRARWSYVKDNSGRDGADAGWIDDVRVDGPGYGDIQIDDETEGDLATLSWPTLPCRHYQVEWRPKDESLPWQFSRAELATGTEGWFEERAILHADRDYRVTLIEPPSFTRTPPRDIAKKEGDSLTLAYEAEGSGTIRYLWKYRRANDDRWEPLPIPEDGREIVSAGKGSTLHIDSLREAHEGEYIVVAENKAGREPAPPVSVAVFQPPRLEAFVVRAGQKPKSRVALQPGTPVPPKLSVNAGESLQIEPKIAGSGSIRATWERQDPENEEWQYWSEDEDPRLRIEQAAPEHAGLYRLELEHKNWGKWEGPRVVAVDIISPPTNLCVRAESKECLAEGDLLEVNQFEPLTLSVEAEGSEPFEYQWFIDNRPISEVDGGRSPSLTVSTERGGVFQYTAAVGNTTARNVHTGPFEITVNAPPRILQVLVNGEPAVQDQTHIEVRQFDRLTLLVETESTLPISFRWYRNDSAVPSNKGGEAMKVLIPTDRPGVHKYFAHVSNDLGTTSTPSYNILVTICPGRILQGREERIAYPTDECSLDAALRQVHMLNDAADWQLSALAIAYAELGNTIQALKSASLIQNASANGQVYRSIVDQLAKRSQFHKAIDVATRINDALERTKAFPAIARMVSDAGNDAEYVESMKSALNQQVHEAHSLSDPLNRGDALTEIAVAQAEIGDVEGALETASRIRETNPASLEYLQEIMTPDSFIASQLNNAISRIVDTRVFAADFSGARQIVQALKDPIFESTELSRIAIVQAKLSDYVGARDTIRVAVRTLSDVARDVRDVPLRAIALALARMGEISEALNHANSMEFDHARDLTIKEVVAMSITAKDFAGAEQAAQHFSRVGQRVRALGDIAVAKADLGEHKQARNALDYAMQLASSTGMLRDQVEAWCQVSIAQAKLGNAVGASDSLAKAFRKTELIKFQNDRESALTCIAVAQVNAGDVAESYRTIERITERLARHSALWVVNSAAGEIARSRAEVGEVDLALQIAGNIRQHENRVSLLSDIAKIQVENRDVDGAAVTFLQAINGIEEIRSAYRRKMRRIDITRDQVRVGHIAQALREIAEVYDREKRDDGRLQQAMYRSVAHGAILSLRFGQARVWDVDGAIDAAKGIVSTSIRGAIVASIVALVNQEARVKGESESGRAAAE